jgi:hypothetical protein
MKKLMLTSALAGLLVSGNAIAQTTISGELRVNLKAAEAKVPSGTTTSSKRGFGTEQQINFATKGKLNVGGLDYAAGFSIENDGAQSNTLFNENTYIDITNASSGTTLSLGLDHIQRSDSDRSAAVLVGFTPNELSTGGHTVSRFRQNLGPAVSQGMGIAVLQAIPNIGTLSYNYVPTTVNQTAATTTTTTTGAGDSESLTENNQESGYEYGFTGSLGVKGLNTYYFKSASQVETYNNTVATTKSEARSWGANYNFGQFTVGYADKKHNIGAGSELAANVASGIGTAEHEEKHYGASYAVNNNMTVGLLYAKAEVAGSTVETKLKGINIGYNLGPVNATIGYAQTSDVNGTAGNDVNVGMIRLIGAF